MKLGYFAFALPLLVGFSCAPSAPHKIHVDPGRYVKTIKEGNLERSYILRVPKNYDNKTNLPVVFVYHGWTSSAAEAEVYTQFGAKSDKEGFILVVPDGTPGIGKLKGWNSGFLNLGVADADDVKLTSDILDQLERDMYVDEKRVYAVGHSNGAMMAYTLGAKLSDRLAAIGVVSGTVGMLNAHVDPPNNPISAIIFHGKADQTVPYDNTVKALIQCTPAPESAKWWADKDGCGPATRTTQNDGNVLVDTFSKGRNGAEVEFVTINGGGHMWPGFAPLGLRGSAGQVPATDMIWDFFKAHPKR